MIVLDPHSIKIIKGIPPKMKKSDRVAIDSEFFQMVKGKLHRPTGSLACATFCPDGKTVYMVTDPDDLKKAFANIEPAVWIIHNAKFDIGQLRRYTTIPQRTRLWDTMLIEQIMFMGYYDDFALRDLARRHLDIYMEKDVRNEFEKATVMTKEMELYSAMDPAITWQVYQKQKEIIDDTDLDIWVNIELPFLWVILGMSGIMLDKDAWLKLARENYENAQKIAKQYKDLNLNSPAQVAAYFKKKFKREMPDGTGADILKEIIEDGGKGCEFAQDLLTYRTFSKRSSTYGESFIEEHVEDDNCVYSDIFQIGAVTGRTSSRHPNMQNQPNEQKYRDCFIADPDLDQVIIVADYGAQEPRIAGYFAQDEGLIAALNRKGNPYIEIAKDTLKEKVKKGSIQYKHTKSTILGIFYGITEFGLAKRLGVTKAQAARLIKKFRYTYPGIDDYIERQTGSILSDFKSKRFPKAGYVQSASGRKLWLNPYVWGWPRDALNYPIQGTAADMLKKASYRFLEAWAGDDFYTLTSLVLLVHDEIVICVPKSVAKNAKELLEKIMEEVAEEYHPGIRGVAEAFVGPTWGCKS